MASILRIIRQAGTLFLIALMVGAAPVAASQSQEFDPGLYVSGITGIEVEVGGPFYQISDVALQRYVSGQGEIIQISSDSLVASVEISFFDDTDTPQQTLDIYLGAMEIVGDNFTVIDRGISDGYHYAAAVVEAEGVEIAYFVQVYEDVDGSTDLLEAILTIPDMLENDLAIAQEEIRLDGEAFMKNVDPVVVASVFAGEGPLASTPEASPVAPTASVEFSESGAIVSVGEDFTFLQQPEVQDGIEIVRIEGPGIRSMVAIGQTGDSPADVLDGFGGGILSVYANSEVVDEEIGTDSAWRLLWIPKEDGSATYMLMVADTTLVPGAEVMHAHEVPSQSVAGSIMTIQAQVAVNGEYLLADVDPRQIEEATRTHLREKGDSAGTPDVLQDEPEDGGANPREGARLPDYSGEDDPTGEAGNTSETGGTQTTPVDPAEDVTPEPTEEAGAQTTPEGRDELTDSSWRGGIHGHVIAWNPAVWFVDEEFPGDLVSDIQAQEDRIVLQVEVPEGRGFAYISVRGDGSMTPADYLDYWTSDEAMASFQTEGLEAEVLDTRTRGGNSAIMIQYTSRTGIEILVIRQAVLLDDGTVMEVTFDVPLEAAVNLYEDASTELTIDGDPILRVFGTHHLEEAIEAD